MFLNSIRWKIQAWHGALLAVLVGGLLTTLYNFERRARIRELDLQLQAIITPLRPMLGPRGGPPGGPGRQRGEGPPGGGNRRARPEGERGDGDFPGPPGGPDGGGQGGPPGGAGRPPESEMRALALLDQGEFYYAAWSSDGVLSKQSQFAPANLPYPGAEERSGFTPIATRGEFRELTHRAPNGACIVVGASLGKMEVQMHRLAVQLALAGLAVVGVGLAGGWWLVGHALNPIARISEAAEKIASGDLSNRIEVKEGQSELGQLAAVLNHSFERLEKVFEQQRQFTADASHELRTPVSVILTQVQLALSRERKPEEYREILTTCERAAERMRKLVNQLLVLARVDSGEFELAREEHDLADIAQEALEMIKPLATQKKVTLQPTIEPVKASVDAIKIGQVLINLLNNAVQHNPEGVEVRLALQLLEGKAVLRVRDNGVGIPQDAIAHLFDRFYRLEKSRTHVKGNTGLGLAISKAIVEAHGGEIRVKSVRGQGTEFTVELPLEAPETVGKPLGEMSKE